LKCSKYIVWNPMDGRPEMAAPRSAGWIMGTQRFHSSEISG